MLEIVPFLWRQNLGWIENIYTGWFMNSKYNSLEESNDKFEFTDINIDTFISRNRDLRKKSMELQLTFSQIWQTSLGWNIQITLYIIPRNTEVFSYVFPIFLLLLECLSCNSRSSIKRHRAMQLVSQVTFPFVFCGPKFTFRAMIYTIYWMKWIKLRL